MRQKPQWFCGVAKIRTGLNIGFMREKFRKSIEK
jgi:hypothetical protein